MPLMHDSMVRLYEAAKTIKKVEGQSALAVVLGETPQVVNNWEARGISAAGALKAQARIGCDANWLMRGVGAMLLAWPFPKVPSKRFADLDSEDRGYVQGRLLQAIEECEGPHKTGEITPLDEKTIVRAPPARGKVKKRADR